MPWAKSKYKELGAHWQDYRKEYKVWQHMVDRCTKPHATGYHRYGGRGIRVCDRWLDKDRGFINFYHDMGKVPYEDNGRPYQLDRINNDGDYCPENCRWATLAKNNRNRSNNVNIYIYGEPMCMQDVVCGIFHINRTTVGNRVRNGQDPNAALIEVLKNKGYHLTKVEKGGVVCRG